MRTGRHWPNQLGDRDRVAGLPGIATNDNSAPGSRTEHNGAPGMTRRDEELELDIAMSVPRSQAGENRNNRAFVSAVARRERARRRLAWTSFVVMLLAIATIALLAPS
jgi:hypothetical protein